MSTGLLLWHQEGQIGPCYHDVSSMMLSGTQSEDMGCGRPQSRHRLAPVIETIKDLFSKGAGSCTAVFKEDSSTKPQLLKDSRLLSRLLCRRHHPSTSIWTFLYEPRSQVSRAL